MGGTQYSSARKDFSRSSCQNTMRVNFMARVFILGAGASRFAGYPLSLELWKFVRDFPVIEVMAKRRADSFIEKRKKGLGVFPRGVVAQPTLGGFFPLLALGAGGANPRGRKL